MSLYKAPLEMVVESINRLNKIAIVQDQYIYGTPVAVTPRGNGINTEITISAEDAQSAYAGSVTVGYRRLDLAELGQQVNLLVPVKDPQTTADIFTAMNKTFGTKFDANEIVVRPLTTEEKVVPGTVLIEAKSDAYGWIGSIQVATRIGGYNISDYVTVRKLPGLNYPAPSTTRPYAHIYSYWRDFSDAYDKLHNVQVGTNATDLQSIRDALVQITGDAWKTTGTDRYSLQGAEIIQIADLRDGTNTDFNSAKYDWAVVVKMNDTYSLGLTGNMTLHFKEPLNLP